MVASTPAAPVGEDGLRLRDVGAAGANFLTSLDLRHSAVALGWGTTTQAVSDALGEGWGENDDVFQLNGAVPVSSYANGAG
jgi:deoxyribonucleoside regulator